MKKKSIKNISIPRNRLFLIAGIILLSLPFLSIGLFELFYFNRAYPGVYLDGVNFAGKDKRETVRLVEQIVDTAKHKQVVFALDNGQSVSVGTVGDYASYDIEKTSEMIIGYGRQGDALRQTREKVRSLYSRYTVTPAYGYNKEVFDTALANAVRPYEEAIVNSTLSLSKEGISASPSKSGSIVNRDQAMEQFESYLALKKEDPRFQISLTYTEPQITQDEAAALIPQANAALSRSLTLKSSVVPGNVWQIDRNTLFSFMTIKQDTSGAPILAIEDYKVASYSGQIANLINKEPIDARFQVEGDRVTVFEPAQPGTTLDTVTLTSLITDRAFNSSTPAEIDVPVKTTDPAITTANVNNYGIKELVGKGTSKFKGSPAGRIHNLALASSKLNGVLIAPGETSSMYKVVGEVEKSTGYQDAFIIKDGRTVPGVGGGLCQVSTTLFRAALNAGLPIVERHQHAYRVYYYEQDSPAGIDAAVYFPSWDFKFVNDTGNYLLLQTKVDTKAMTAEFNLYGVKDGRVVEIAKPAITNQVPPPPELRIDDPNLKRGTENEVEHAVWGADVSFSRKVTKGGQQHLSDVFKSRYKAWQRVVMVGVKDN